MSVDPTGMDQLTSLTPTMPSYHAPDTSGLDQQIAQQKQAAGAAEQQLEGETLGGANVAMQAAGAAGQPQQTPPMPTDKEPYEQAMKTAPLLAILATLGGKASQQSGVAMLGSLNGMMEGLNAGAHDQYEQHLAKWKQDLADVKERHDQQMEMYNLMLKAYSGRADAAQMARDYALTQTHDAMDQKENKIKDSVDLFKARAQVISNLEKQELALEKIKTANAEKNFTPEQGELLAALGAAGISLPAGLRSQAQIKATLDGLKAKYPDKSPDEIAQLMKTNKIELTAETKEAAAAGTQAGRVGIAENEIQRFAPVVLQASDAVPRGKFMPITKLLQTKDSALNDPALKKLQISINAMLNAYDQLAARGGTDKDKRAKAHALITSADSPEALRTGIEQFQLEASAAQQAAQDTIHQASGRAGAGPVGGAPGMPAAPQQGQPQKQVVRTGTDQSTGRKVVQYSDGTVAFAQ